MGYAARVMRGLIIDFARNRHAQKRGGEFHITSLGPEAENAVDGGNLIQVSDALDELSEAEPELAEVVDMRFFCGFTFEEIAAMKGVSDRTVQRQWEKARIYLHHKICRDLEDEAAMSTLSPDRWQEVSPYLDEVLSLPEQERAEWLDSFPKRRPDLAELLQELLNEQSTLAKERFLERGPVTPASDASFAGRIAGAYKLLSPIGRGGMGSVWLAERNDGRFERQVAVKFLNFAVAAQGAERFKREGSILGRLAHPHIAELMDAGVTANGEPYLVLEYVEGEPIDNSATGARSIERANSDFSSMC